MKRLTLKQLLKNIPEVQVKPLSDKEVSSYINDAYDILLRRCILCGKDNKNTKGMMIHYTKAHKEAWLMTKKMKRVMSDPNYGAYFRVYWDKLRAE